MNDEKNVIVRKSIKHVNFQESSLRGGNRRRANHALRQIAPTAVRAVSINELKVLVRDNPDVNVYVGAGNAYFQYTLLVGKKGRERDAYKIAKAINGTHRRNIATRRTGINGYIAMTASDVVKCFDLDKRRGVRKEYWVEIGVSGTAQG